MAVDRLLWPRIFGANVMLSLLQACAVIETYEDGNLSSRRIVAGAPAVTIIPPHGEAVHVVRFWGVGLFSDAGSTSFGAVSATSASFPARCGAVFVHPSADGLREISRIAPGIHNDCVLAQKGKELR
jgi:hypothetical protein